MTYIDPDPETTSDSVYFDIDGVEEAIHNAAAKWLSEQRLDIYIMDGHVIAELESAHTYRMPFADFFDERNDDPPDLEDFLLFGLKVYRERYDHEPGQPYENEED